MLLHLHMLSWGLLWLEDQALTNIIFLPHQLSAYGSIPILQLEGERMEVFKHCGLQLLISKCPGTIEFTCNAQTSPTTAQRFHRSKGEARSIFKSPP